MGQTSEQNQLKAKIGQSTILLAAERGWNELSMQDVAAHSDVSYGELCRLFPSKSAVLAAFVASIDDKLADEVQVDLDEPARGRLFDVLMERLELLRPYRAGLAAIAHDLRRDLASTSSLWGSASTSMEHAFKLAKIDMSPLTSAVQVQGLVALYARVFRVFMVDDSEDLAATMNALDKQLADAERWAIGINETVANLGNPDKLFAQFTKAAGAKFRRRSEEGAQRSPGHSNVGDVEAGPIIDAN